ncbi:MAG: dTDP-glucose 4,6-dehydratase [Legionellales bacterium]|jgi:dTDP-glucose 4,6-dehydratase
MTVLVTGGAGFIGSNFVLDWLAQSDETVVNLDKLTYAGNLENLHTLKKDPRHIFIQGDICDAQLIPDLLNTHQPRALIHFAAESHVDRSIAGPREFINTNIIGTFNLLESCRMAKLEYNFRFLHVSTDEVYGSLDFEDAAFTEQHAYQPNSPYSASKAASDHLVRAYYHTYGLPVLTTNCSNNYGPNQYPEKLIPLMIQHALLGKALPIQGTGKNIRDWLYVSDHCSAIRQVLKTGQLGETYNIGGCNEKNNLEVVNTICELLDELAPRADKLSYKKQISFVPDRLGHDLRYAINAQKIEAHLGWKPQETFETGIRKTVQWYLNNKKGLNIT